MTIDEAIKVLNDICNFVEPGDPPEEHQALKLGIEALKTLPKYRKSHRDARYALLPGETKD